MTSYPASYSLCFCLSILWLGKTHHVQCAVMGVCTTFALSNPSTSGTYLLRTCLTFRSHRSKDYHFKSPDGAAFSLNVCRALVDDTWNVKVPKPDEVGGTVRRAHGDFSLGSVNTTVDVRAGAPVLTYTGGSECTGDAKGARGATVVRFVCDRGFGGATGDGAGKGMSPIILCRNEADDFSGKPEFIAQVPQDDENACTFLIEWRTQVWSFLCPLTAAG